jgi:hypothetical protein
LALCIDCRRQERYKCKRKTEAVYKTHVVSFRE